MLKEVAMNSSREDNNLRLAVERALSVSPPQDSGSGLNLSRILWIRTIFRVLRQHVVSSLFATQRIN